MKNIFRTCPRQLLQFIRWEWHIINNSGLFHKNGFKNIIKCLFKILKNSRKTSIVYLRLLWLLSFTAPFLALFCLGQNETGNLWVLYFWISLNKKSFGWNFAHVRQTFRFIALSSTILSRSITFIFTRV